MNETQLYTPQELSKLSKWPEQRIRNLLKQGKLPYIRVGIKYLIPENAIQIFIDNNMVVPCPDTMKAQNLSEKQEEITKQEKLKNLKTGLLDLKINKMENLCTSQQVLQTIQKLKKSRPK